MRRYLLLCVSLLACFVCSKADELVIESGKLYRITSDASGAVTALALGANHGVNSPVCMASDDTEATDCYWYLKEIANSQYAIINASSGEYLTWDDVRSDNPIRRYLNLTSEISESDATSLWSIELSSNGKYAFRNAEQTSYIFNFRMGSYALGTYSKGGTNYSDNELFTIEEAEGGTGELGQCGMNDRGLYYANSSVDVPFVYTTDDSNPVYYYIANVRSGYYLDASSTSMTQSESVPSKRFYFKQTSSGCQILIEGGGYVSGVLPQSYGSSATDVTIVSSGTPSDEDHVYEIKYVDQSTNPGYSIGVMSCSENDDWNTHVWNGTVYWNDYYNTALCYYSVDAGSTFNIMSKDSRHISYLKNLGYLVPKDTTTVVDPPVDPSDDSEIEAFTSPVVHVCRADGKIDAIPQAYIDKITETDESISITTLKGGPTYQYARYEVDSVTTNVPANLPKFNSFKFNNKFNRFLISDAEGMFYGDSLVVATVVGIGKRLRPSFKLDDDVQAFIGDSLQHSKYDRVRFENDVVYTVARRGSTILRRTQAGTYKVWPYGRQITVRVDFATDHSTSEYNVPTVYITTDDGTSINSKNYYWSGTITIDGAGIFPDMETTPMQIKGRGNTSWTSTGKAPYHMKFEEALKPFGLSKGKNWNIIANAMSRSMTTNATAQKMAQLVEVAGFNHEIPIELYINGEYRGAYNFTENIRFANNSVDIADETNAALLELDSYYDEAYKFRTTYFSLPVNIKEPDFSEGTTALTLNDVQSSFNEAITGLYYGEDMSQYFDLDYLARFLFVDEYSENLEFMHPKSTFLYNENVLDKESKYIFGPCWDFDWAFGYEVAGNYFTNSPLDDYWTRKTMEASTFCKALRYCGANFDKVYYRLWHNFITNGSLDEIIEFCDDYYNFASPSFVHNTTRWGDGSTSTYNTVTKNAKSWLEKRANYIYDYMTNTLGYGQLDYLKDESGNPLVGDVNGDGAITTADIVCVFNYILGLPNEDFDYDQADTDGNDMITVKDLINIRNLVATSSNSGRFYNLPEAEATISTGTVENTPTGVVVPMTINVTEGEYSGIQFDLKVPAGMTIEDLDISNSIPDFDVNIAEIESEVSGSTSDSYRVSIYSSAMHKIPVGQSKIELKLAWGSCEKGNGILRVNLSNVMFVNSLGTDERSTSRSAAFTAEELTGINDAISVSLQNGNQLNIRGTENTVLPIYSADGRLFRLYNVNSGIQTISLPHGVYIINKQKIIVK